MVEEVVVAAPVVHENHQRQRKATEGVQRPSGKIIKKMYMYCIGTIPFKKVYIALASNQTPWRYFIVKWFFYESSLSLRDRLV